MYVSVHPPSRVYAPPSIYILQVCRVDNIRKKAGPSGGSHLWTGCLEISEVVLVFVLHLFGVRGTTTFLVGILIETLCISRISYRWDNRAPILAIIDVIPLYTFEKWMCLDSRRTSLNVAQAVRSIDYAELEDNIFCFFWEIWLGGEMDRFGNNSKSVSKVYIDG